MNCFQKIVSLIFWTTQFGTMVFLRPVVNCFQKIVSLIFWTTNLKSNQNEFQLWIAFKKLYLWYSEQPILRDSKWNRGCELLSKNCIFDILNNPFYVSVDAALLWIAFKKLYLWYSEQPIDFLNYPDVGCELLSKNCIFDILNNLIKLRQFFPFVVNCFQKIVSLIFWTTDKFLAVTVL